MNPRISGHALMLIGLAGVAGYEIVLHLTRHPLLQQDAQHGLWIGAFLGIKLLGLIQLSRERQS